MRTAVISMYVKWSVKLVTGGILMRKLKKRKFEKVSSRFLVLVDHSRTSLWQEDGKLRDGSN